ncbi:Selenoprotein S [Mizuhopecten yessoensis]|uniref:Selenoprotein S n=1 Tax=Mizuhopecten yessoensis TaxID=6573 RepID=A0A210Q4H0_MIZYE|nr:Selenoprotein S [Mizuhopecten yessoensis]
MADEDVHPPNLQNENPQIVSDVFGTVTGILQQYGWFIVLACLVLLYIRSKIKPAYNQMKKRAVESRDKKIDPDVAQSRLEAMERARQRLQEEHDTKASRFMEQQVIKEEEKRKTKIEEWENLQQGKAYRSKVKPSCMMSFSRGTILCMEG